MKVEERAEGVGMGGAGVRKEVQELQGHSGRQHKCVMSRDLDILRMHNGKNNWGDCPPACTCTLPSLHSANADADAHHLTSELIAWLFTSHLTH